MVHWPGDAPFERTETESITKGAAASVSEIRASVHIGTHVDAPLHYLPGAAAVDSMPIVATCGRARVIAISDPELIRVEELTTHHIAKHERVLFKTVNSDLCWKDSEFHKNFVHIPKSTAKYLVECGVQSVGMDYLSVGGFEGECTETHRILLSAGIWIIEGLQLARVEPGEYELFCLPLKIVGSEGAPARAVLRKLVL